jgi:hypothetical protein
LGDPGLYVLNPLLLHAQRRDTPDWNLLLKETLALTKMNWNGTQLNGALPITLKASRQVGDILKYVPEGTMPDSRYRFYMRDLSYFSGSSLSRLARF